MNNRMNNQNQYQYIQQSQRVNLPVAMINPSQSNHGLNLNNCNINLNTFNVNPTTNTVLLIPINVTPTSTPYTNNPTLQTNINALPMASNYNNYNNYNTCITNINSGATNNNNYNYNHMLSQSIPSMPSIETISTMSTIPSMQSSSNICIPQTMLNMAQQTPSHTVSINSNHNHDNQTSISTKALQDSNAAMDFGKNAFDDSHESSNKQYLNNICAANNSNNGHIKSQKCANLINHNVPSTKNINNNIPNIMQPARSNTKDKHKDKSKDKTKPSCYICSFCQKS